MSKSYEIRPSVVGVVGTLADLSRIRDLSGVIGGAHGDLEYDSVHHGYRNGVGMIFVSTGRVLTNETVKDDQDATEFAQEILSEAFASVGMDAFSN